jgi:hypothetical protein
MWLFPDLKQWRFRPLAALLWVAANLCPAYAAPVGFRTRELPWAAFGSPYRVVLETFVDGRCTDGGVTISAVDGALPRGLELRGETITGTPEEFGAIHFRLRAGNNCGAEERDFVLQVTGRPILRVTPEEIELEYRVGGPVPEAKVLLVSATWPKFPYSLTKGSGPWLRIRQQAGVTPLPGSPYAGDVVRVQIVPESLTAGTYESELVLSGPSGAAALTVPVRLRVVGPPAAPTPVTEPAEISVLHAK